MTCCKEEGGEPQQGHDEHDWGGAQEMTEEEVKTTERQIDQALRQGEIIRGKNGRQCKQVYQ